MQVMHDKNAPKRGVNWPLTVKHKKEPEQSSASDCGLTYSTALLLILSTVYDYEVYVLCVYIYLYMYVFIYLYALLCWLV